LKVLNAEFVTSAGGGPAAGIPGDGLAQIAFVGRSNVGKSSLINALCRSPIARTSAAPGKTRLANVYRVTLDGGPGGPGRWDLYFVDLPGYGYARGGAEGAEDLRTVAEGYCTERLRPERGDGVKPAEGRPPSESERGWGPASTEKSRLAARESSFSNVIAVLLLVDSRHPGQASDLAAARWLDQLGLERHVVATKIDKLSRTERVRNLKELERTLGTAALPVSADSGEGLNELWQKIAKQARK
jgi:GTP-binding protein